MNRLIWTIVIAYVAWPMGPSGSGAAACVDGCGAVAYTSAEGCGADGFVGEYYCGRGQDAGSVGELMDLLGAWGARVPNPSAVYCEMLGYEWRIEETPAGQRGICVLPDGIECGSWDFYRGLCGQEWSYCNLNGLEVWPCARNEGWFWGANCHLKEDAAYRDYRTYIFQDGQCSYVDTPTAIWADCPICRADVNRDGMPEDDDLSLVLANWGKDCGQPDCSEVRADVNRSGLVEDEDLSILLAAWRKTPGACVDDIFPPGLDCAGTCLVVDDEVLPEAAGMLWAWVAAQDVNRDGLIDDSDLSLLLAHRTGSPEGIPEPVVLSLLVVGALVPTWGHGRRRSQRPRP